MPIFVRASSRARSYIRQSPVSYKRDKNRIKAYIGRKHVGTLRLKEARRLQDRARGILEVGNVNVIHEHRRKGIATEMYKKALAEKSIRGIRMSEKHSIVSEHIPTLYKKLGAKRDVLRRK